MWCVYIYYIVYFTVTLAFAFSQPMHENYLHAVKYLSVALSDDSTDVFFLRTSVAGVPTHGLYTFCCMCAVLQQNVSGFLRETRKSEWLGKRGDIKKMGRMEARMMFSCLKMYVSLNIV